jgi:HPt (histidine-containing phosphotransfer) domain-containing protein
MPERASGDVLDEYVFRKLAALEAHEAGFLGEYLAEFHEGVARRLAAMRAAIDAGDGPGLASAAHGMRGSCGTLGAGRMAALAARMEELTPAATQAAGPLLHQLEAEYESVRRALDARVPAAPPGDSAS